ncbi:MAG: thiamine phosphate synthase [Clostridia bacterium]|nr:thiamine phosphate synthase [Clostridia bacterium]
MKDLTLYFITDTTDGDTERMCKVVEAACKGGADIIQLREKNISTRDYIHLAECVLKITKAYNVPLIINDRVDVALASGADGIHLGQSDMPVDTARKICGPDMIIGATAKTTEQAKEAYENGADYLGCGAVYPSSTKKDAAFTPVEKITEVCNCVPIPVVAIGGLNENNLDILKGVPVKGMCFVSAIMNDTNPEDKTKTLRRLAENIISE